MRRWWSLSPLLVSSPPSSPPPSHWSPSLGLCSTPPPHKKVASRRPLSTSTRNLILLHKTQAVDRGNARTELTASLRFLMDSSCPSGALDVSGTV